MSDPSYLPHEPSQTNDHGFLGLHPDHQMIEISDYLTFDNRSEEDSPPPAVEFSHNKAILMENMENSGRVDQATMPSSGMQVDSGGGTKKIKAETTRRVAFRTKSNLDVLDDGFKWRKYGKKQVKNSPNPRNYFRCKNEGCSVKKRVERDRDDASYVITSYEGVHNHDSPSVTYYSHHNLGLVAPSQMPLMERDAWTTMQSSQASS